MSDETETIPSDPVPTGEAGEDMHIHKPKVAHSLREFLAEIGVIVVGVLIALALEQAVEWLHWRHETHAARDALKLEAARNLHAADFRQRQHGCLQRRLDEIAVIFERHANGQPFTLRGRVARPVYYGAVQSAWQLEVAGQGLAHMPIDERLRFSEAYDEYVSLDRTLLQEQDAWRRLGVLDNPAVLKDGDWPALHQAYSEARSLDNRLGLITAFTLSTENLGLTPKTVPTLAQVKAELDEFCSPILQAGA
jgi:hypothetical protein